MVALAAVAAVLAARVIVERPQAFALAHEALVEAERTEPAAAVAEAADAPPAAGERPALRSQAQPSLPARAVAPARECAPDALPPAGEASPMREFGDYPPMPLGANAIVVG